LADQRRETRIRHNGPQPKFGCRQPMPTEPTLAAEEVGILPFLCTARVRALKMKQEGAGNVSCFALSTLSHAE
jgi:hypothetical protein